MQGGDLSNLLPPRWLIMFEGLLGTHPTPHHIARADLAKRTRRWNAVVKTYEVDAHTAKMCWDLMWRRDYKFDVFTFLPEKCEEAVREWVDRHNVPAVNVHSYDSPAHLARALVYSPDVQAVVHTDPSSRFTYGPKGLLVDPSQSWGL